MLKLQFHDNPHKSLWLVDDTLRIGADPSNNLVLVGSGIESFHAQLEVNNNQIVLHCEPGRCQVNDEPANDGYQLRPGDALRLGTQILQVVDPKRPETVYKPPENSIDAGDGWRLVSQHPQLKNKCFAIRGVTVLGRGKDSDIVIPYKLLSRQHAQFEIGSNGLFVTDLDSGNGTYVNGRRVSRSRLQPGDRVSFARLSFAVAGPVVASGDALDKTSIRPRIEREHIVAAVEKSRIPGLRELVEQDTCATAEAAQVSQHPGRPWWWLVAVVALLAGGGFVFLAR